MAARPTIGVPSLRIYRTVGIVSPAMRSMGRTRTASPSDTAREVFEVPKSRPNRTGRQLSVAHGGPPKPSLRDGGPPGLRPVPHRAGALGGPAVRLSACPHSLTLH